MMFIFSFRMLPVFLMNFKILAIYVWWSIVTRIAGTICKSSIDGRVGILISSSRGESEPVAQRFLYQSVLMMKLSVING